MSLAKAEMLMCLDLCLCLYLQVTSPQTPWACACSTHTHTHTRARWQPDLHSDVGPSSHLLQTGEMKQQDKVNRVIHPSVGEETLNECGGGWCISGMELTRWLGGQWWGLRGGRESHDAPKPPCTVLLKRGWRGVPSEVRNEMLNKVTKEKKKKCRWAPAAVALMGGIITGLTLDFHTATHLEQVMWQVALMLLTAVANGNCSRWQHRRITKTETFHRTIESRRVSLCMREAETTKYLLALASV